MKSSEPEVSVVIVAGTRRARAGRALQSVLSQEGIQQAEVLLVDTQDASAPVPGSSHPAVRTLRVEGPSTFGEARAAGVHQARGRYVAFLEEHSIALPGWLPAIRSALSGPWVGVGAEIHNANAGAGISDAVWLMNYSPAFRPPARYGPSPGLAGHNAAYRRDVLMALEGDLPSFLQSEVLLHWRLRQQGRQIGVDPAMKVAHAGETTLPGIITGYFVMHRHFAAARARESRWPATVRTLRVLATPLVPWVRLTRFGFAALRERPLDWKTILRFPHVILIAQTAAAVGMAVGYLFGAGDSEMRFLELEANAPRGD